MGVLNNPVLMSLEEEDNESTMEDKWNLANNEGNPSTFIVSCTVSHNILHSLVLPLMYLLNPDYVGRLYRSLHGVIRREMDWIPDEQENKNSDDMLVVLLKRFKYNFANMITDKIKHGNFSLQWFRTNLPRFCVIVVYSGHCINDASFVNSNTRLLRKPFMSSSLFMRVESKVILLKWWYLYYNTVKSKWICTGKICGSDTLDPQRTFKVRYTPNTPRVLPMPHHSNVIRCTHPDPING